MKGGWDELGAAAGATTAVGTASLSEVLQAITTASSTNPRASIVLCLVPANMGIPLGGGEIEDTII